MLRILFVAAVGIAVGAGAVDAYFATKSIPLSAAIFGIWVWLLWRTDEISRRIPG